MKFSEIITPAQITLEFKAADRWMAIDELVGILVAQNCIDASRKDAVIQSVKNREKTMKIGRAHV